jgi:hypothetical protein
MACYGLLLLASKHIGIDEGMEFTHAIWVNWSKDPEYFYPLNLENLTAKSICISALLVYLISLAENQLITLYVNIHD